MLCILTIVFWVEIAFIKIPNLSTEIQKNVVLATTHQPETFTELYFENHTSLPSQPKEGESQSFSFTIHNLEYKTMVYPYSVTVVASGQARLLDEGKVTLNQNGFKTIKESVVLDDLIGRDEVIVNLVNKKQQIDFWVGGAE